jgi:hypothetical protein
MSRKLSDDLIVASDEEAELLIKQGRLKPLYRITKDGDKYWLVEDFDERMILYSEQILEKK